MQSWLELEGTCERKENTENKCMLRGKVALE